MGGFVGQGSHCQYEATHPTTSRAIQAVGRSMAITFSQGENAAFHSNPVNQSLQEEDEVAGF